MSVENRSNSIRDSLKIAAFSLVYKCSLIASLFASSALWDTSTQLLFAQSDDQQLTRRAVSAAATNAGTRELASKFARALAERLMIWDTVYFMTNALNGGPEFEHEFAFSSFWAQLLRAVSPYKSSLVSLTLTGAAISTVSHILACVVLAKLTQIKQLRGIVDPNSAALLYALCPAGIFLMNGYTESLFALLSFVGVLCFVRGRLYLASGALFALSVQLRANGIFWGVLFFVSLLGELLRSKWHWWRILGLVIGGSLLLVGFILPQYQAYVNYCPGLEWCNTTVPSIYSYVQAQYWDNGFLHYWTLPNLPLFLLASPTLTLLVLSSRFLLQRRLLGLALVHAIMFVGAVLFWHVQIITRVASCLPGPAWYVASLLKGSQRSRNWAKAWIVYFVIWNAVQTALYGAFLPPA